MLESLDRHFVLPPIRQIATGRPLHWLRLGWADMRRNPVPSIAYGLLFAICGDIVLVLAFPHPHLFLTAISGFFLVAPLLAAGLYEISRRLEADGQHITFIESLACWSRSGQSLAMIGLIVALAALLWERISAILFALFFGGHILNLRDFLAELFGAINHSAFLGAWFIGGGVLALAIFALTAVSVPMILDRNADFATAAMTSLRAVTSNLEAMFLWAMIIVVLTSIGFATMLFGLVVVMPVIGHATWHAYRELID